MLTRLGVSATMSQLRLHPTPSNPHPTPRRTKRTPCGRGLPMAWKIGRGRYGAEALTEEEIQQLQTSPETAAGHIAHECNSCRCAARDQRATLEPALRNVLHMALAHGHRVTLTPGLDSYDIAIQIDPDRPCDSDDRIVHSRATPIRPPATVSQSGPSRSAW